MSGIQTRTIKTKEVKEEEVPEVNVNDTSSEDKLLDFVNEQIEKMRAYSNIGGGCPNFFELNEALANWSNMNCSLIVLDVMAKQEYQKAKDEFEDFMAEKYMVAREALNPISLSSTKWASSKELEYYVMNKWPFEYRALRDIMNAAEKKVSFCRRMLENMESFKYNIGTLSKNVQAEVLNLSGARSAGLEQN